MEFKKRKYKAAEVEKIINENSAEYEKKLAEQRGRIKELTAENRKLSADLYGFKQKEENIAYALTEAEARAGEIRGAAEAEYELSARSLRIFSERWKEYFDRLKEKYPLYPAAKQAEELRQKLAALLKTGNNRALSGELSAALDTAVPAAGKFDPRGKIEEYIAATESNGFNLEEVLNPGELKLEDLCKELGLIEEKE